MAYVPDIRDYQQLEANDPYGTVNCMAYAAAILVDATTLGKHKVTGRQVRAHTNEPVPQGWPPPFGKNDSPGLNLPQVDAATKKIAPVDFDTRLGDNIIDAETRLRDGRYASVSVMRSVLVDHGMAGNNRFRGSHEIAVRVRATDGVPLFGDPLVPQWTVGSWGALWQAAGKIAGQGRVNAMFTRDLTADYEVDIDPTEGHVIRAFRTFIVKDGIILRRDPNPATTSGGGVHRPCTAPHWYPWSKHVGRSLVQIIGGHHDKEFVLSHWARQA